VVTTVLFDDRVELLHDRLDLREILPITNGDYYVRGTTALLDAVGIAISKIVDQTRRTPKEEQPGHTLFVITTDGMENASREFSYKEVRRLIDHQKSRYGWEFLFLGANIDAAETAQRVWNLCRYGGHFQFRQRGYAAELSGAGRSGQ
jgi:hypothetical protein